MANPFDEFDAAPAGGNPFDEFDAPTKPRLGPVEEPTFAEKHIAPVLEKTGLMSLAEKMGISRGGVVGRAAMGAADPGVAIAQLAANAVGAGEGVNKRIQQVEKQYQEARGSEANTFDPARLAGNVGMSVLGGAAAPALPAQIAAKLGTAGTAAVQGAGFGALQPVTDGGGDYWTEKAKQAGLGAIAGGATAKLAGALARVISPKASVNPELALLRKEGVEPTIGQSLGGAANALEEKLTSLPIMGDRISAMRNRAIDQLNTAAINRSQTPIGKRVEGFGQEAVKEAGDNLSDAYTNALKSVNHVNFNTPTFNANLGQLQQMATGLVPGLEKKFERTLQDVVLRKMSPNGSIAGADLKAVDSELGKIAASWRGSSTASEREFGDAVLQLKTLLKQEVATANPQAAAALKAADEGWANLVRVEGAAARGVNNEGRFTPAQLGGAVKAADQSVRDRATARGAALMQDLANAGSMLGNRYPDSGTVGRGLMAGLSLSSAVVNPTIPAALVAGAGAYTPPVQNALRALVMRRPKDAPRIANELRRIVEAGRVVTVPMVEALAHER